VVGYRIVDIIINLNKRSELGVKNYEIAILATIIIDGDPTDSAGTDLKIDVVKILIILIFIRSVDIYQIN
jgi:hypothetical protein